MKSFSTYLTHPRLAPILLWMGFFCCPGPLSIPALAQDGLTSGGPLKPEQAIMDIRHYTLDLRVDTQTHSISGAATIDLILSQATPVLVFDLLDSFHIHSVQVNGTEEPYTYANKLLTITPHTPSEKGRISVKVVYDGKPHVALHPPWEDGFIWSRDSSGNPWIAITAEGIGGKLYFPCKDHPSDEPNEGVDMYITVPQHLSVAGPGILKDVTRQGDQATFHWCTQYPINNYSIIFNVGRFKVFTKEYTTIDGHQVPMEFYVLEEHADKAPHHLEILEKTAREQEKYFGEYPWVKEKIGIVETPHLGMEHQTMNAYGNKFHYIQVGGQDYDDLMHHEFGHEWWGNKITAKDWADYWIHEGICTFGDALYIREYEGEAAYNDYFKHVAGAVTNQYPIIRGKDIDEESAYQPDIYGKGAFFMHTLRFVIGDSLFFPILKGFATDSNYTYDHLVSTDDVQTYFSRRSGIELKPLFDLYLRTTDLLQLQMQKLPHHGWTIRLTNLAMPLPMDIRTDKGIVRYQVSSTDLVITSKTAPVIDPDVFYLKKITVLNR
jgi:aminopeptidase N